MYLNENQLITWIQEAGQVEQAINNVLSEHKLECRDEILETLVYTSMNSGLFKGSRRAVSHISEPARYMVVSKMIEGHKKGFGFRNRSFFFTAWLETIKISSVSNRDHELMYFIAFITQTYSPSEHLISLVSKALNLLDFTNRKPVPLGIEEWDGTVNGLQFASFRVF